MLLAACADQPSNGTPALDRLTTPAVVEYPPEKQAAAATEMEKFCNLMPTVCEMMVDYGVMRDQSRAALGKPVDVTR